MGRLLDVVTVCIGARGRPMGLLRCLGAGEWARREEVAQTLETLEQLVGCSILPAL